MANPRPFPPTSHDLPSSTIRRLADCVLNLFYPELCLVCSTPVSRLQDCGICGACWKKARELRISGPLCPSCGLPYESFENEGAHLCGRCSIGLPPYSGARAFGRYSAELSRIVRALKFDGRRRLAGLLAPLLASTFLEFWETQKIDLIVPVPLHPRRKRERGYNQAALLGRSLATLVGLPCCNNALARVRNTLPQVGLSDKERAHNMQHAFRCVRPRAIKGRSVLLIDDVITTGSTVASACETLLEAGAMRVSVLAVARAVPGSE
jgi:ComF family protein